MWNDKSKLWWKQPTANGSRLDIIILCGFIACSCVIHFYPGVEGQSGERVQEVFQFYYVVESIWLFTTDSFRRVIMMLSGQGDPPIVSIKGIMWAHIGSLTQKARHARGENYFSFLCSRVSRALRCKLSFRPIHQRNTLDLPYIRSWPLLVRVWTYSLFSMYLLSCWP